MSEEFCEGCFDDDVLAAMERQRHNQPPTHTCEKKDLKPTAPIASPSNVVDLNNLIAFQVQQAITKAFGGANPAIPVSPGVAKAAEIEPVKLGAKKAVSRKRHR